MKKKDESLRKNIKNLFGPIICSVFLLIIIITSNFESATATCENPNLNCTEWQSFTDNLEIAGYPGCLIECQYYKRFCIDPNTGQMAYEYNLISFNDPSPSIPCNDLLNNLWIPFGNPNGTPNWAFIQTIYIQLGISIAKKDFLTEYNNASITDKSQFECPHYKAKYVQVWKSCSRIGRFIIGGPVGHGVEVLFSCNDQVCCRQSLKICWNTSTGQLDTTETWEPQIIQFDQNPPPIPGAVYSSPCLPWCEIY